MRLRWEGYIYVRPMGRGICLVDGNGNVSDDTLDDALGGEGFYAICLDYEPSQPTGGKGQ